MNETSSPRSSAWMLIIAVAVGGAFYMAGQNISARAAQDTPPVISVSGEGKVSATPDIAMLTFGVTTGRKATAKEAISTLSTQMNAVMDAVSKTSVDKKDISTEQFSLSPEYDWSNSRQTIIGYNASEMLNVKVHNLDSTADVLAAATGAGANQAGNVNFTFDDPEKARSDARAKALTQAKEKAQTIASQLGLSLYKITAYSEGANGYPPMPMMASGFGGAAMDKASVVPLPSGNQDVVVDVTLTYELR